MEFNYARFLALVLCMVINSRGELCPKQCDCDLDYRGLNRATCVGQNLINIEVGVPSAVQAYSLTHNVISELDNFCFKEAGYQSLEILDLSYNLIFWIGLHAFSGLNRLHHLDLSNNRLRYIPSDLFWDTPLLTNLDLSSNVFDKVKNEPFIMHSKLEILNLSNCRLKALPERLLTRLPNLKKLDLRMNYMTTITTQVLVSLRKLQRIELGNDFWKCTADFMSVESWIISRGITYQKQCNLSPKKSEKIISAVTAVEIEDVNVEDVWNITKAVTPPPEVETTTPLTPFEKFDKNFSAVQAFIIGLEVGLAIGIIGTYIWLTKFCHCGLSCPRPAMRRRTRRGVRRADDMTTSLIWSHITSQDQRTPPSFRRQQSLPERSPYGVPTAQEPSLQVDAIRLPSRAETPPPPYYECRINL